jgi:hypothetical protein
MMLIHNGIIYTSRPLGEDAVSVVESVLGSQDEGWLRIDADMLEIQDFLIDSLEILIDELVDRLGDMGISIRGRIDYCGEYEGTYFWEYGKKHEEKTQSETAIMDAGDQELITELKRRGYRVEIWHEFAHENKGYEMN